MFELLLLWFIIIGFIGLLLLTPALAGYWIYADGKKYNVDSAGLWGVTIASVGYFGGFVTMLIPILLYFMLAERTESESRPEPESWAETEWEF